MATSNTIECFRSFVGEEMKGVLVDERPAPGCYPGREPMTTYTFIFKSGRGLTVAANPAGYMVWWEERPRDLERAIERRADELRTTGVELADVLSLAGS